tara:strand:- start:245 stop:508 length:264 start_codon:yes stop_codon:yes gene_type:complete
MSIILFTKTKTKSKMQNQNWKPKPTDKASELESAINAITGVNRQDSIRNKKCTTCGQAVTLESFTDEISLKEFHISGMCQVCQDEIF